MTASLNITAFRAQFPEFATTAEASLTAYWGMASQFQSAEDGYWMAGPMLQLSLDLLTAHIAKTLTTAATGDGSAPVTSASEGAVSVGMMAPPVKNGWQYWLASTPYGVQLWALLGAASAGGAYVGGSQELSAYRKAGGVW